MAKAGKLSTIANERMMYMLRVGGVALFGVLAVYILATANLFPVVAMGETFTSTSSPKGAMLDKAAYDKKVLQISKAASTTWDAYLAATSSNPGISLPTISAFIKQSLPTTTLKTLNKQIWPVQNLPYPNAGAILPFNRIVAYYGNFYSKQMGVLGQYDEATMLAKFRATIAQWEAADPTTPVMPAIDYIVITAQGSPGKDGKYRARMPDSQIDIALDLAKKVNGIVILEFQVGLSNIQTELPIYADYLKLPNVHVALDPEFAMHNGQKPGDYMGSMSSTDINWAANYLADIVKQNNLPPKVMIVHRFTGPMVTGAQNIKPLPEVQIVMDMDGWGSPIRKQGTYQAFVQNYPVQFTGFKLFYKNDLKPPSTGMMTPAQVLNLTPAPLFIQYQ